MTELQDNVTRLSQRIEIFDNDLKNINHEMNLNIRTLTTALNSLQNEVVKQTVSLETQREITSKSLGTIEKFSDLINTEVKKNTNDIRGLARQLDEINGAKSAVKFMLGVSVSTCAASVGCVVWIFDLIKGG